MIRLARENPRWGCVADPRRAPYAWHPARGEHDPADSPPCRARTGAPADQSDLEGVPPSAGEGSVRVRLLHGGNRVPKNALRPVLHRALHATGPCRRRDHPGPTPPGSPSRPGTSRSPGISKTSTSCCGIGTRSSRVPSTRSCGRKVYGREDPRPCAEGERVRRTLGRHRPARVPRSHPRLRPAVTYRASSPRTPSTTTARDHIGVWTFIPDERLPKVALVDRSVAGTSSAGSSMGTSGTRHDPSPGVLKPDNALLQPEKSGRVRSSA